MRLHECLDPADCFCAESLDTVVVCPACKEEFILRTGVVYFTMYSLNGHGWKSGNVPFCRSSCYMQIVHTEGTT